MEEEKEEEMKTKRGDTQESRRSGWSSRARVAGKERRKDRISRTVDKVASTVS